MTNRATFVLPRVGYRRVNLRTTCYILLSDGLSDRVDRGGFCFRLSVLFGRGRVLFVCCLDGWGMEGGDSCDEHEYFRSSETWLQECQPAANRLYLL